MKLTNEALFSAMGSIDEGFILEAEHYQKAKRAPYRYFIAAAACLTVCGIVAMKSGLLAPAPLVPAPDGLPSNSAPASLPPASAPGTAKPQAPPYVPAPAPLQMGESDPALAKLAAKPMLQSAMGFEGYAVKSAEDLVSGNPLSAEHPPKSMPVYKNTLSYIEQSADRPAKKSAAQLEKEVTDIAALLGIKDYTITHQADNAGIESEAALQAALAKNAAKGFPLDIAIFGTNECTLESADYSIRHSSLDSAVTVQLKAPHSLPSGMDFTPYAPPESLLQCAEYLAKAYAHILPKNAVPCAEGGAYQMTEPPSRAFALLFYANGGEEAWRNYCFRTIRFVPNESGALAFIRFDITDLTQKLGDYPLISAGEALTLLSEGHYSTDAPAAFMGAASVQKVELVYRADTRDEVLLPYYRFYCALPQEHPVAQFSQSKGLTLLGTYYVPAVEPQYLTALPVNSGSVN